MRIGYRVAVLAAAGAVLLLGAGQVAAQGTDYRAPRTSDGVPDLNGIWQAIGTAHWDLQDHPAYEGLPGGGAIGARRPSITPRSLALTAPWVPRTSSRKKARKRPAERNRMNEHHWSGPP